MWRMRQARECRHTIHGRIKNELGPLGRSRIFKSLGFQSSRNYQVSSFSDHRNRSVARFVWSQPSGSVQFVLHMGIAVTRAAHERRAPNDQAPRVLGNYLFAAQAVLSGDDSALIEMFPRFGDGCFYLRCFCSDDTKVE